MSAREQAREMLSDGLTYNEIAKELNITWSQARYHSDPEGDWRKEAVAKPCHDCKAVKQPDEFARDATKPDRLSYRCKVCSNLYTVNQNRRRKRRKAAQKIAEQTPDKIFTCKTCGMKRDDSGIWYTTERMAQDCCKGATAPHLRGNCRPTRGKYRPRHRFVQAGEYA